MLNSPGLASTLDSVSTSLVAEIMECTTMPSYLINTMLNDNLGKQVGIEEKIGTVES
jgi:hypothetical protein